MEKEKIIDKIRKLLELSKNNPNKEEAILALTKARELMFKHNVDMENIKKDDTNYFEKISYSGILIPLGLLAFSRTKSRLCCSA